MNTWNIIANETSPNYFINSYRVKYKNSVYFIAGDAATTLKCFKFDLVAKRSGQL